MHRSLITGSMVVSSLSLCFARASMASVWTPTTAGTDYNWDSPASNWDSTVPDSTGATADLQIDIAGAQTIRLNGADRTVGTLKIGDAGSGTDSSQTIANVSAETFKLVFDVSSGSASIDGQGGTNTISTGITLNDSVAISNTSQLNLSGAITTAAGQTTGIVKSGTSKLYLSNSGNTFNGGVTLNAGTLEVPQSASTHLGTGRLTLNGGVLSLNGSNAGTVSNKVTLGGDAQVMSGNNGLTLNSTAADAFVIAASNPILTSGSTASDKRFDINAPIAADSSYSTTGLQIASNQTGASALNSIIRFSGGSSNTYTGQTSVNSGRLELNKSGTATAILGDLLIGDGSTKAARVTLFGASTNQIADTKKVTIASNGNFNVNSKTETIATLDIRSGGTVTLGASGRLSLGADEVSGVGVYVNAGGRLRGNGTLNSLVDASHGVIEPGTSAGVLTIGGDLVLGADVLLEYELNWADRNVAASTLSDRVDGVVNFTPAGTLNVLSIAGTPTALNDGDFWRLINFEGTALSVASITPGGVGLPALPGGLNWQVRVTDNLSGPDYVDLVVVPEPASLSLLALAGGLLMRRRRAV